MQIWVVMHYQHDISALVPQMSFLGKTSRGIVKCWLFSKATISDKIVETLYSNRENSENKRIHTPPLHSKLGLFVAFYR